MILVAPRVVSVVMDRTTVAMATVPQTAMQLLCVVDMAKGDR